MRYYNLVSLGNKAKGCKIFIFLKNESNQIFKTSPLFEELLGESTYLEYFWTSLSISLRSFEMFSICHPSQINLSPQFSHFFLRLEICDFSSDECAVKSINIVRVKSFRDKIWKKSSFLLPWERKLGLQRIGESKLIKFLKILNQTSFHFQTLGNDAK